MWLCRRPARAFTAPVRGDTLAVAMKASGAFPRYAVDMVGVGEASGRLEEVLRSLGVYYDEEDRLFAKIRSSVATRGAAVHHEHHLGLHGYHHSAGVRGRVRFHGWLAHRRLLGGRGRVGGYRLVALGITLICAIVAVGAASPAGRKRGASR